MRAAIVAPRQVVFEEGVEQAEQVTAAHLLETELGFPERPVGPRDRHDRVAVPTDDGLQRHLHGEIKMGGDERLHALDYFSTIEFEGIGEIVEGDAEERLDEPVRQAVQDQFVDRVVMHLAPTYEPRTKNAVRPFQQSTVTLHDIFRTI